MEIHILADISSAIMRMLRGTGSLLRRGGGSIG